MQMFWLASVTFFNLKYLDAKKLETCRIRLRGWSLLYKRWRKFYRHYYAQLLDAKATLLRQDFETSHSPFFSTSLNSCYCGRQWEWPSYHALLSFSSNRTSCITWAHTEGKRILKLRFLQASLADLRLRHEPEKFLPRQNNCKVAVDETFPGHSILKVSSDL